MRKINKPLFLFLFCVLIISNNHLHASKNKNKIFDWLNKESSNSLPTIVTMPIIQIGLDSAIGGGNITNDGGETILASGICISKHPIPTLNDIVIPSNATSGQFVSMIRNLYPGTAYYVRAFATNASGTAYGVQRTFATDPFKLGDKIYGGTLFYVFAPGDKDYKEGEFHGLVFGGSSALFNWSNLIDTVTSATDTTIGTGDINTDKITTMIGVGSYAAYYASSHTLAGYSDWYLPNIKELELLANPANQTYYASPCGNCWSSTEISKTQALSFIGATKKRNISLKTVRTRAVIIRKF